MKEFLYHQGVTPDRYLYPKEPKEWLVKLNAEAQLYIPQEDQEESPVKDQIPIMSREAAEALSALKIEVCHDKEEPVKKEEELVKVKEGERITQTDEENAPNKNKPESVHFDFARKSL